MPKEASTSSDQSRVRTSMPAREASEGSVDRSPVSLYSIQSLHHRLVAPCSSSFWFSTRQRSNADAVPAYGPRPETWNWSLIVPSAYQVSMMSPARPSVHRIAGPAGSPLASTSQVPSPWPVAEMAAISAAFTEEPSMASRMARVAATQTVSMSSSAM